jgi:hypothetical protein
MYRIPPKILPPNGPGILGGGTFSGGGNFRGVEKLSRPRGAARLSQNGTALVWGVGAGGVARLREQGGRTAAEEEAKKRKTETKPSPFWLKERHGLGRKDFRLPETDQKLNPPASSGGGNFRGGEFSEGYGSLDSLGFRRTGSK